jgi:hypothetical protein
VSVIFSGPSILELEYPVSDNHLHHMNRNNYAVTAASAIGEAYTTTVHDLDHAVHQVLVGCTAVKQMSYGLPDVSPKTTTPVGVDAALGMVNATSALEIFA